jgi:hypothetical protein
MPLKPNVHKAMIRARSEVEAGRIKKNNALMILIK